MKQDFDRKNEVREKLLKASFVLTHDYCLQNQHTHNLKTLILKVNLFKFYLLSCMYMVEGGVWAWHAHGGQRTTSWSWSPFTFTWVLSLNQVLGSTGQCL